MSYLKKLWKFLSSMKFALILLLLIVAACVLGSVIPQGESLSWYTQTYGPRTGALIYGTGLDDVFRCTWFLVLTVILCANLLLCNLLRLPQLLQRWRAAADPEKVCRGKAAVTVPGVADPEAVFARLRMPKPLRAEQDGKARLFACKNRIGIWGAWVCHLGILLLIVGFTLGQFSREEYTVTGVPGQTLPLGDTGYQVTIDDFDIAWNDSGTPAQFTAKVTMRSPAGETQSGSVSVNEPGRLFGYSLYQNSTGTAARLTVRVNGEVVQDEILLAGQYLVPMGSSAAIIFDGYDPAALFDDGKTRAVYDYTVYDMNRNVVSASTSQLEGEIAIKTESYEVRFSEAQNYTLLQVKRDSWTWLALAGGLITLLGLILAFYLQTRQLWALQEADGTWTLSGRSRKGGAFFADQVKKAIDS